jgi:hypothetical protein
MTQMHELLAVESGLQKVWREIVAEAKVTFVKKMTHFLGSNKTLEMKDDNRVFEAAAGSEHKELTTTVDDKLDYVEESGVDYLDALFQKELSNQEARADLVIDGVTVATGLPATFLLGMEDRLKLIREMYQAIPTLQPGINWELDEDKGKGIYVAKPDSVTEKTEQVIKYTTVATATDNHAEQVRESPSRDVIGRYTSRTWSGMITPAKKSDLLARLDVLQRAIKQARQRANQVEVPVGKHIAADLFKYLREGKLPE